MHTKTILITGASRGIGRGIALALADSGCHLALNCVKNKEKLEETAAMIRSRGGSCAVFVADISNYEETKTMFHAIKETFGTVDILINNAGISIVGLFQDMTRDEWEHIMNTNIGSVYNCCHFAVPSMIHNQFGKIINISSVWGIYGASCEVAYSASKGAVNAFTKALAKELAPSHIHVNAIACGAIDTDMNAFLEPEEMNMLIDEIPAGRLGRASEVGTLVKSLILENDYLTGQVIQLDGGWI